MLTIKIRAGRIPVFLALLAVALTGCQPAGPRALLAGKHALDSGNYPAALDQLRRATTLLPTNALAWEYLGLACQCLGDVNGAVQAYQKSLALDRTLAEPHFNLGCLGLNQNRADWLNYAQSQLTLFTALRTNSVPGWIQLGVAQLRLRELAGAGQSFGQALRLSPNNAEALNDLGVVLVGQNLPRSAAGYFSAALKQQPDYAPALLNLGVVAQRYLNDRPLATRCFQKVLAEDPANRQAQAIRNWLAANAR